MFVSSTLIQPSFFIVSGAPLEFFITFRMSRETKERINKFSLLSWFYLRSAMHRSVKSRAATNNDIHGLGDPGLPPWLTVGPLVACLVFIHHFPSLDSVNSSSLRIGQRLGHTKRALFYSERTPTVTDSHRQIRRPSDRPTKSYIRVCSFALSPHLSK